MASPQNDFIQAFKEAYERQFQPLPEWFGGQRLGNYACLPTDATLRRNGIPRADERYELGDLRAEIEGATVILEYESGGVSTYNLLKYWPYIRGELDIQPSCRLILCHFSHWGSWGTYRDAWAWLLKQMVSDPQKVVTISAKQFDHGATDIALRDREILRALEWIGSGLMV